MDCSLPGSLVHGIFQARVVEWVAISFSRASSQSRDRTWISHTEGRRFTVWATREAQKGCQPLFYLFVWATPRSMQNFPAQGLNPCPLHWKGGVFTTGPPQKSCKQTSKIMLKILQARLQQYVNHELPDVQAGFRKGRGTRDQIANICWIMEKAREFEKNICFCFIDCAKAFVWITINCGKFFKRWEYQTTWPASWETYMQIRKQQLELDMEQQTGSK